MTTSHSELERLALDQLEPQLLRKGYQLVRNPSKGELPAFIGGYIPDAIAIGQSPKIALEIKGQESSDIERGLSKIRKLFEGRNDWIFQVYYFNSLAPSVAKIPSAKLDELVGDITELAKTHRQAAFVLAWSLLEASVREAGLLGDDQILEANRVVGLIAAEGYIRAPQVSEFLELANLRNRVVHGQLDIEPTIDDVGRVLELVSMIRSADDSDISRSPRI